MVLEAPKSSGQCPSDVLVVVVIVFNIPDSMSPESPGWLAQVLLSQVGSSLGRHDDQLQLLLGLFQDDAFGQKQGWVV